ncbi:hypothetical protein ES703_44452 [subsurface metagenome]
MAKTKWLLIASLVTMLVAVPLFGACNGEEPPPSDGEEPPPTEYTLYIGGTQSLTGAYAEDSAALLSGMQDYVDYVNETKMLAPWRTETFPDNVTLEVLWRDDELNVEKALIIYEELKAEGILTYRCSGTSMAMALLDRLNEDRIGATSMASGPYLLSPPKTIFTQYPIYTDECAAFAQWFLENWEEDRAPRFAYFTNDAFGRSILIDEMDEYLEGLGYEIVGTQIVPMVLVGAPPTTALLWLKDNNVDCTFGCMINPGSQPTIKEAVRLGMGPGLDYEITFGFAAPAHLAVFCPAMGVDGDGVVVGGSYPPLYLTDLPGIAFCNDLLMEYRPDEAEGMHIMYPHGVVEGMIQVEAVRLALLEVSADEITPLDVLEYGFYQIKDLDTGDITSTPLTFGPSDIEGVDMVRLDQAQGGEVVFLGNYPTLGIFKHE